MKPEGQGVSGRRIGVAITVTYFAVVVSLDVLGAGLLAGYLTMPGWLLLVQALPDPDAGSCFEVWAFSWAGNLILLLASAAVNVAIGYVWVWLMRKW